MKHKILIDLKFQILQKLKALNKNIKVSINLFHF